MKLLAYTKVKRKGAVKMFQTVFKRYEKKYIIDGGQYEEVKNYLTYNAVPDEYGKSRVCSLYYDTPDNRLIRASLISRYIKKSCGCAATECRPPINPAF